MSETTYRTSSGNGRVRSRAELLGLILETANEAFVSMDAGGAVTEWNPEAERTFGWSRSEAVGRELAATIVPDRLREAHRQGLARFLRTGKSDLINTRFESTALHRDGREFPVEVTISAVEFEGRHAFNAFLHDISDRKRFERYLRAQNSVNEILVASQPSSEMFPKLLRALGESLDWDLGIFWSLDEGAALLRCDQVWVATRGDEEFAGASRDTTFSPDEGLPGRAWARDEPMFIPDVLEDEDSPRVASAMKAGLRSAIALPVRLNDQVVGVLEFLCTELRREDEELLQLLRQISHQVSLFLDRRSAKAELRRESTFLQAVLDCVEDGIVACDAEGTLTVFNDATRKLHGLPAKRIPAQEWAQHYDLYLPDGHTRMGTDEVPLYRALRGESVREAEMVIAPKNGPKRVLLASGRPLVDANGRKLGAVVAMHDVTAQKRAEQKLAYQALHDPLTGLPNRVLLLDRLDHALKLSARLDSSVAVLFIDLDRFKAFNDSFGHPAADGLLVDFAARITKLLRSTDTTSRLGGETVARLGGDEFVVLCEGIRSEADAMRIAERIGEGLTEPFLVDGNSLKVTASIGIAVAAGSDQTAESLIRDADVAMYQAKEEGRNRHKLFDESMRAQVVQRLQADTDLRGALERQELRLHYQPIVSVSSGRVAGVEALVRWQHPERGLVDPAEFVPLAEENGLIVPIGAWVLEEAARQVARWEAEHPEWPRFAMSVNVSVGQFAADLWELVAGLDIDRRRLVLEITESLFVQNPGSSDLLEALADIGVRLALDDFGTGYSSLSYLTRFPLHTLKLDRSFVSDVNTRRDVHRIVAATVDMAHGLEMAVVAEGVETEEQLDCLRTLGCNFAQGYLFGEPAPAESIGDLLARSFDGRATKASA